MAAAVAQMPRLPMQAKDELVAAAVEAAAAALATRPALSSMTTAQLQAECEERGLGSAGTKAALRALLRLERKRRNDPVAQPLQGRGAGVES